MSEITKDENVANSAESESVESLSDVRFKKRVIAFTVGAVLLLAVLIMVMCYQLIAISVDRNRKSELTAAISELDAELDSGEETIGIMQKKWWIVQRARELNYRLPDDK